MALLDLNFGFLQIVWEVFCISEHQSLCHFLRLLKGVTQKEKRRDAKSWHIGQLQLLKTLGEPDVDFASTRPITLCQHKETCCVMQLVVSTVWG